MSKLVAIGLLGLFYLLQNKQHNKVRMCNKKLYKNRRTFLTEAREGIDMNFKKLLGGRKYMLGIFLEMIRCVLRFSLLAILWWHCHGETENKIKVP